LILCAYRKEATMKKNDGKDSVDLDKVSSHGDALTRRQAIKRIAMGAGIGIAGIVFGTSVADASKHCCIDAYPDYNYQDSGGGYYNYSSYGYSSSYRSYYSLNSYYSFSNRSGNSYSSYYAYSSGNYYTSYGR
jgi:hypothetical protein